jgi:CHAD domain-containing protein
MAPKKPLKKPRLSLRRGEKISKGLKSLAMLQVEAALAELHDNNVSPGPVHNARTYIKKVRSIILLAAPALGRMRREYLLELLHEAGSRLGPLRDSEVQVQSLDLALETAGLPAEQFASLRNGLADIAKQRRANDCRQVPRIAGFLEKVLKNIPEWPLDDLGARDIRRRIRRTYRRGRTTIDVCSAGGDEDLFHTWRKLTKHLGYQLRLTAKFWPEEARPSISAITNISEIAGRERDYNILLHTLKNGPKTRSSQEAIEIVSALLPPLRQQALEAGLLFYEPKPKVFIDLMDL